MKRLSVFAAVVSMAVVASGVLIRERQRLYREARGILDVVVEGVPLNLSLQRA